MAFQLSDGTGIPVDVPFTIGTTNYPANWLRLSTADEKTAAGIKEVADPAVYDSRFYNNDGSEKSIEDYNQYYEIDAEDGSYKKGDAIKDLEGNVIVYKGVKSVLKANEKSFAGSLLSKYDWYVTRKSEKGTTIPTEITTYRDDVRTACNTRETEITNCADTAALITLYGNTEKDGVITPNMTQYPTDPNDK
tara:strand:- start:190 stop:765 length:576 start_codon:yes stop_codon:yes gene_type:complete